MQKRKDAADSGFRSELGFVCLICWLLTKQPARVTTREGHRTIDRDSRSPSSSSFAARRLQTEATEGFVSSSLGDGGFLHLLSSILHGSDSVSLCFSVFFSLFGIGA